MMKKTGEERKEREGGKMEARRIERRRGEERREELVKWGDVENIYRGTVSGIRTWAATPSYVLLRLLCLPASL